MKYILALDQGTTSSRAILFDHDGGIEAVAQREFKQLFPKPGWVEHDPQEIVSSQCAVADEVLCKSGLTGNEIEAIGITNQRETTILWDRITSKPIYNAIVWQDRRTAAICENLREEGLEPLFQKKTGLLLDPYFSGTKIKWILDNIPHAREKADKGELAFGTVDSWLIWNLTNGKKHITDATNASRTLLYNIQRLEWDNELLSVLNIPHSLLPEVRSSSEYYTEVESVKSIRGIPLTGIAGDQQAALFGQNCLQSGMAKNTYGTGCFLLLNIGKTPVASKNKLLTTVAWKIGEEVEYALEGSIFIGGAVVQWLRDGLGLINDSTEVESLAREVGNSGGVYFVPAFTGLGAPHWEPHARGTLVGLTRGTTSAHIARAALESMAFQSSDVLEAMQLDSGIDLQELRVDGGACVNNLLMQFQCNLLQVPVVRPKVIETTALGAAYLAGLAVGYWKDLNEISNHWHVDQSFSEEWSSEERENQKVGWRRALACAKEWGMGERG